MIKQSEKLNLSGGLAMFEDHLDDICDALATNITAQLEALPLLPVTDDEYVTWVWAGVREIEVEQITEIPLQVIRRIQARKYYESIPHHEQKERITDEDIQRAKEVPIEELYQGHLKQGGGRLWGPCNFHQEETASFCVHKDNRWSCFGACNAHGDSIDFVMKRDGVKFIQAVKILVK